jgi:hypothetical protein
MITPKPRVHEYPQTLSDFFIGCSERPSSKAAASEDRRGTLWGARCDE